MSRDDRDRRDARAARANRALLRSSASSSSAMFGFGFALVPFYEKICEVTGLRNIAQADDGREHAGRRDAHACASSSTRNVRNLPWTFRPLEPVVDVHPGALTQVDVRGRQHDRPADHRPGDPELRAAARRAVFPEARLLLLREADAAAGRARARCRWCSSSIPALPADLPTITLSYTFFEVEGSGGELSVARAARADARRTHTEPRSRR